MNHAVYTFWLSFFRSTENVLAEWCLFQEMVKAKMSAEEARAVDRERCRRNREIRRRKELELRSDLDDVRGDLEREMSRQSVGTVSRPGRAVGVLALENEGLSQSLLLARAASESASEALVRQKAFCDELEVRNGVLTVANETLRCTVNRQWDRLNEMSGEVVPSGGVGLVSDARLDEGSGGGSSVSLPMFVTGVGKRRGVVVGRSGRVLMEILRCVQYACFENMANEEWWHMTFIHARRRRLEDILDSENLGVFKFEVSRLVSRLLEIPVNRFRVVTEGEFGAHVLNATGDQLWHIDGWEAFHSGMIVFCYSCR